MHNRIIKEAREWVGTPFHHNQCLKGHGVDCVNLVVGVGHNLGICELLDSKYKNYSQKPSPKFFISGMEFFLNKIENDEFQPGDICAIAWKRNLPMHAAIYIGNDSIIHTSMNLGRVVEVYIDDNFRSKIHSWWRYKNGWCS